MKHVQAKITPDRHNWHRSGVFTVNFEHILLLFVNFEQVLIKVIIHDRILHSNIDRHEIKNENKETTVV